MSICTLIRRDNFFDILINEKHCGSGTWAYVDSAVWFYRLEGYDVKVIE